THCIENLIQTPQPFSLTGVSMDGMHKGPICPPAGVGFFGGAKSLIEPDIQGLYTDEINIGGEYEIIEDLSVGGYYTHRNLGTIIEDASVDNAKHYYILNPSESVSKEQVNTLLDRAKAANVEAMRQMSAGNMVAAHDYLSFAGDLNTFAET